LPAPGLQDIGVSLRGQKLVGRELGLRPSLDVPGASELHHDRLIRMHRRVRAPAADGQHADLLSSLRGMAALLTPAR
jgi:hypothetical protein